MGNFPSEIMKYLLASTFLSSKIYFDVQPMEKLLGHTLFLTRGLRIELCGMDLVLSFVDEVAFEQNAR